MGRKQIAALCTSCDAPLRAESAYCPNCGRPTVWASHDERVSWEVRQWRSTHARGSQSSTVMMLLRTEAGYELAAVDKSAEYIWDQPLHPDRETAPRANPHASHYPLGNRATNGHAQKTTPEPDASPEAMLQPEAVAEEPAMPIVPVVSVGPVQTFEAVADAPPVAERAVAAGATDDRVRVSKKAVAVGIVLAVGLPLSGKVLSLSRSRPESSHASLVAPAVAPVRPVALRATGSGFTQISPDAARFAVVISNPNRSSTARGVTVVTSLLDRSGRLLGRDFEQMAAVPAHSVVAVAGQTAVAGPVARLSIRVTVGAFEGGDPLRPFVVRGVRMSRSGSELVVRAAISAATATRQARIVVVHIDRLGRVVGGDFAYADLPRAPRATTVVVSTSGVTGVDRVQVYVVAAD